MFCLLALVAFTMAGSLKAANTMTEVLDKKEQHIKLGQTPVLSFEPDPDSKLLASVCHTKQAILTDYVKVPYRSTLPLPADGFPFAQTVMLHDASILLYRRQPGKDVTAMMLGGLPNFKPHRLDLNKVLADVPDHQLNFMVDLIQMQLPKQLHLYFMIDTKTLGRVQLNKKMENEKFEKLKLPLAHTAKRILIFNGTIYALQYNKVVEVMPDPKDFNKGKVKVHRLKREYTDMSIVNGSFVFIRGFSTLVFSHSCNPEAPGSFIYPETFHHAVFSHVGFDHFMLKASSKEQSRREFWYFTRPNGANSSDLRSLKLKKAKRDHFGEGKTRLIQFKHALYHIHKKTLSVEYLNYDADIIKLGMKLPGRILGVVGHYDRLEESLHPLLGIKHHLHRRLKLKKVYLNCLHSQLVCKSLPNLLPDQTQTLTARVLTRKNDLHLQLIFKGLPSTLPLTNQSMIIAPNLPLEISNNSVKQKETIDQEYKKTTSPSKGIDPEKHKEQTKIQDQGLIKSNEMNQTHEMTEIKVKAIHTKNQNQTTTHQSSENKEERHWIHIALMICLLLVLVVLCLVKSSVKRQIRGLETAHDILTSSAPARSDQMTEMSSPSHIQEELVSKQEITNNGQNKPPEPSHEPHNESSLNHTEQDSTIRPAEESTLENEDLPMPDMTL